MAKTKTNSPNIVMRGTSTFWVHHFKAELDTMKKNRSWQYGVVRLDDIEHVHMYHTKNSQGRPLKYTAPVGGHFHEIITEKDEDGNIIAKCGPALHTVYKKLKNGKMKKLIKEVSWFDDEKDDYIKDTHTHEMTYLDSEKLSPEKIKKDRELNQQMVQQFAHKEEDFGI